MQKFHSPDYEGSQRNLQLMKRVYTTKIQSERPVKMARIYQIEQSKDIVRSDKEVVRFGKDDTKIVTKDYILNDVNALEKKWNMRNVEAITVSDEANDGSNVSVVMKTHFRPLSPTHPRQAPQLSLQYQNTCFA